MDVDRFLDELHNHGIAVARSAEYVAMDTSVPSCPDWTVGRLLGHLAKVQAWSIHTVRTGSTDGFAYRRPEPDQLVAAYLSGLDELVVAIRQAPEDRPIWTLWPVRSPRLYWARRQAHEAAIHRVDLELAVGYGVSEFEPDFAADGIDELLMGMLPLGTTSPDGPTTMVVEPLDRNVSWTIQIGPTGTDARREASANADLSVFGLSSDLYRWVWNRAGDDEVSLRGDVLVSDWWRRTAIVGARSDRY